MAWLTEKEKTTPPPAFPESPAPLGRSVGLRGHCSVEPALGTLKDFEWLVNQARKRGVEIALDFAINCSPDHPYVKEHPDWFHQRPDGTIKYAENPPKKYQDIYPLNFHCEDWKSLWNEMLRVVRFWIARGVRIFRVDNPHTKPVSFWEWLIGEIRKTDPDIIFLAEAFTRPKMMRMLGKIGYNQSYTYFTWRETREELQEYATELTQGEMREYYRANFWPNGRTFCPTISRTLRGPCLSSVPRWRPPFQPPGAYTVAMNSVRTPHCQGARSISIPRNTSSRRGTGTVPAISSSSSAASMRSVGRTPRCTNMPILPSSPQQ
ncbi:MAG: alpha-amylase family glycosyl hydrolase [Verrucomicrobiales bacterium]